MISCAHAQAQSQHEQAQYAQAWGSAEAQAYYAALKSRFDVQIMGAAPAPAEEAASAGR